MASLQAVAARPVACRAHAVAFRPSQAARVAPALRRSVLVRADPIEVTKTISNLERAIAEAKKQCDEASAGECAAAWDTVEELSAAIADKKASTSTDPLEKYCDDNPEADECREQSIREVMK